MQILSVEGIAVRYGRQVAVRDLSFVVEPGEVFGLIGPNGAGKTSTLAAIAGLHAPCAGQVRVLGIDARREPRRARACLGVQLQGASFQPDLSLWQLVQLYGGLYGVRLSAREAKTRLEEIGLGAEAGKRAKELSGGQQQRLGLLIACIHDPPLLLLDEPTTGLDPAARRALWGEVDRLRRRGSSVLLTTHSMEEAAALSDRIGILVRGGLVALDPPDALVRRYAADARVQRVARGTPTLEDVFLALAGPQEVRA